MKSPVVLPLVVTVAVATLLIPRVAADVTSGHALLDAGKIRDAITDLRTTVDKDPKNPEAWSWLAEAYLRASIPDSAEWAARHFVDVRDDWNLAYSLLTRAELAQNRLADAIQAVKTGFKKSEKRRGMKKENASPIYTALGLVLLAQDSTEQAVLALTQAQVEDPKNALAVEALGDAYFKRGVPALAVVQYETAVQMDSTDPGRNYKLAQAYLKDHRFNEAARSYERAIQLNPENTKALLDLSKIYVAAKAYKEAVPVLGEYVKRVPDSQEGWSLYLDALHVTNYVEETILAAKKVLSFDAKSVKATRYLARAQAEMKQSPDAIASYQSLAAMDTLQADDLRMLGKAYAQTGQDTLAAATLEKAKAAFAQAPADSANQGNTEKALADIHNDLGSEYMKIKDFDRASVEFKARMDADTTAVGAYLNYALCNMVLKRWDLAGPAIHKVVDDRPDYTFGYVSLARYYSGVDSTKKELETYQKVIDQVSAMPDTSQVRYKREMSEAYAQIGYNQLVAKRYPEALEALTKSIKIRDDDPQTHLWKAQTYHNMAQVEDAKQEYRATLKLDPENKQAKKGLEILNQIPQKKS